MRRRRPRRSPSRRLPWQPRHRSHRPGRPRADPAELPTQAARKAAGQSLALKVFVNESGRVTRVLVQEGQANSELVGAAMNAILRGKYEPATEKGAAVKGTVIERFDF